LSNNTRKEKKWTIKEAPVTRGRVLDIIPGEAKY